MRYILLTIILVLIGQFAMAQGYSIWVTGDSADVVTNHQRAVVLAGGGGDHDGAMRWMLRKADGGDVVVIRTSGSDGYNDYFYSELDINVNSVTSIRFDSANASFDPVVIDLIRSAEVLFIAGGDQTVYKQYWKNTPIQAALNFLINEKKATVGGTSAGMAVLGEYYYTPTDLGVTSEEALNDPFHPYMDEINVGEFLEVPYLENVITDTHFDQRERAGRTVTFLARLVGMGHVPRGIAANEYTAVGIDSEGLAWVFGDYPAYDDFVYFLQTNCDADNILPETLNSGNPLHWNIDGQALKIYKIAGTNDGTRYFDLNNWQEGRGGDWEDWYVTNGSINKTTDSPPPCVVASIAAEASLTISNPVDDQLFIQSSHLISKMKIITLDGRIIQAEQKINSPGINVKMNPVNKGIVLLHLQFADGSVINRKLIKL